jgi:hypothetical protein
MDRPLNSSASAPKKGELNARNFPTAEQEASSLVQSSRYDGPESAYRLAFTDSAFLLREELRPVRMQLELLKPELVQSEHRIESTIVIFGSARILPETDAVAAVEHARLHGDASALVRAEAKLRMSRYYEEARSFSALVTERTSRPVSYTHLTLPTT